jgi:hypothetical protein
MQMKRHVLIFGVAVAMIAGTGALLAFVQTHQKLSNPGVKVVPVPIYGVHGQLVGSNSIYLPETIAGYSSEGRTVDDSVLFWLPQDTTYGQRYYKGADGFETTMNVVLMGRDRTSIHRPQLCLPSQGWKIYSEEQRTIPIKEPYPYLLPVTLIKSRTERELPSGAKVKANAIYVYWFVSDEQLMSVHKNYQWSIVTHLLTRGELQRWAYVSCFAICKEGEEDKAFQRVSELIAAATPQFQLTAGPREAKKVASLQNTAVPDLRKDIMRTMQRPAPAAPASSSASPKNLLRAAQHDVSDRK